jgi:hypothetical protein
MVTASKPAVAATATTVAILAGRLKRLGIHLILGMAQQSLKVRRQDRASLSAPALLLRQERLVSEGVEDDADVSSVSANIQSVASDSPGVCIQTIHSANCGCQQSTVPTWPRTQRSASTHFGSSRTTRTPSPSLKRTFAIEGVCVEWACMRKCPPDQPHFETPPSHFEPLRFVRQCEVRATSTATQMKKAAAARKTIAMAISRAVGRSFCHPRRLRRTKTA